MEKSKNNIIKEWLDKHGSDFELEENWFENTTGCVQDVKVINLGQHNIDKMVDKIYYLSNNDTEY